MSELLSVVIPCFNQGRFLGECLRSVLAQSWDNIEVIIIDDGSTDGSLEEARRLAAPDGRIKVFPVGTNMGAPYARNLGMLKSKGDYVMFLDADDYLAGPDVLSGLMKRFAHGLHFVYGDRIILESDGSLHPFSQAPEDEDPVINIIRLSPMTSTVLFRRTFFTYALWNPEDQMMQEYNMIISGVLVGARYGHAPFPTAYIRQHDSPSRISLKNRAKYPEGYLHRLKGYRDKITEMGGMNDEREAFFSHHFAVRSIHMYRQATTPEEKRIAQAFWNEVDKSRMIRFRHFKWMSWRGISYFSNARTAAMLMKWKDRLTGRPLIWIAAAGSGQLPLQGGI